LRILSDWLKNGMSSCSRPGTFTSESTSVPFTEAPKPSNGSGRNVKRVCRFTSTPSSLPLSAFSGWVSDCRGTPGEGGVEHPLGEDRVLQLLVEHARRKDAVAVRGRNSAERSSPIDLYGLRSGLPAVPTPASSLKVGTDAS
jgi:hypothetical protein